MIWPCSLFFKKILLAQILITFRSIPDCISDHLSLSNSDSVSLSTCDISGFILVSLGSDLALINRVVTSIVRFSFTRIGRGFLTGHDISQALKDLEYKGG